MRILFIAPYIPSQIRIRPLHFIKGLKKLGHEITFLGLAGSYANDQSIKQLQTYCHAVEIYKKQRLHSYRDCLFKISEKMPLQSIYSFSTKIAGRIEQHVQSLSYDIIHVEHIRAAFQLPQVRSLPAIYDSVDCITSLYQQFSTKRSKGVGKLLAHFESKKLEKYEPFVLSRYDATITTTSRDKSSLEILSEKAELNIPEIHVIQNGVDTEHFKPKASTIEKYSIVFSGKMGYLANEMAAIHFARDIFPSISSEIPEAKYYIVGANPSKTLKRLQNNNNITVTDYVPDIKKYLDLAHIIVCPLRVTVGIQNKLLEAMSMAKAIVTYPESAVPTQSKNKDVFLVANDPEQFASRSLQLMKDESLRLNLGANARAYVKKFFSWDDKVRSLEELYDGVIARYNSDYKKGQIKHEL